MNSDNCRPITTELRDRSHRLDGVVLLAVPVVIGAVFLLPPVVRRAFVFDYTDPSLLTAMTSAYVHLDQVHLLVNLGAYLLVVPTAFALSVLSGQRQRFYTAFATFTLAFPIVLAYLNLVEPRVAVGFGLSGVLMAFVGYMPLALATYLARRFDVGPASVVAPVLFCFGLALIAALTVRPVLGTDPLVATAGVGVPVLGSTLWSARGAGRSGGKGGNSEGVTLRIQDVLAEPGYAELAAVAVCLLVSMPFVAFPADTTVSGGSLNLYVHLLGFALGFAMTYTAGALTRSTGRKSTRWPVADGDLTDPIR